ncbi:hypothetical protein GE061_002986 [Apolygus lucorum]|uniref:Uncharacterized protein n=1 Tax=Apolygus lucorum TaxID=248454 RepID=A0A6A4JLY8_APOLU|nr:hypothetical protein GE061_002986 [Apolygus lucorum]
MGFTRISSAANAPCDKTPFLHLLDHFVDLTGATREAPRHRRLPVELDDTLIDVGEADLNLMKFYQALMKKEFRDLPALYNKLEEDRVKIKSDIQRLQNANIPDDGAKSLMKLMTVQLDESLFKINGLLPFEAKLTTENDSSVELKSKNGVKTRNPKHKTPNQKNKKMTAKP